MKKIIIIIIVVLFYNYLWSNVYFISMQGSDDNTGTEQEPWLTFQYAADQIKAGDTVYVKSGIYLGFSISTAGEKDNPIVFKAFNDDVTISSAEKRDNIEIFLAHYVVIDGFKIINAERAGIAVLGYSDNECVGVILKNNICSNNGKWGIFTAYAAAVVITNNEISYSGEEHGIYVSNSADDPIIRNNIVYHNNMSGIQINADPALAGDGIISNALVENNICYENGLNGGAALNFASIRNSIIRNNIIYDNHAGGMAFWDDGYGNEMGCKNNKIFNNTVAMPEDGRWAISMINNSTGNAVVNNILIHNGKRGGLEIDQTSLNGLQSDFNIIDKISYDDTWISLTDWQSQFDQDIHSFSQDATPLFVGENDYHLGLNSIAINAGENLEDVQTDFEGDLRPADSKYDIGADEVVITALGENGIRNINSKIGLIKNYPNPFNGQTIIKYSLKESSTVKISVYSICGERIFQHSAYQLFGNQSYIINMGNSPSGIYFYEVATDYGNYFGNMILIK